MSTLDTVEEFRKSLPYGHRGIANFNFWLTGVIDTWPRVSFDVWHCITGGES